ncbi:DUF6112 family protein [Nocardioides psychrotolerans]|uniref:DUF6112 family protein n=1 Tax=Nocardioides psychrotolerans TaxID=1005945 RepID=UPI0034E960F8
MDERHAPREEPGHPASVAEIAPDGHECPCSPPPPRRPDFGAVGGSADLRQIVGALLTYGLVIAVLMVVTCGAT